MIKKGNIKKYCNTDSALASATLLAACSSKINLK